MNDLYLIEKELEYRLKCFKDLELNNYNYYIHRSYNEKITYNIKNEIIEIEDKLCMIRKLINDLGE